MDLERWRHFRTNFGRVEGGVLDPRSVPITGDFRTRGFPSTALASRDALCYTPLFWRKNLLSGTDSGRVSQFKAQSKPRCHGKKTGDSRTNSGRDRGVAPEPRSGLKMSDFFYVLNTRQWSNPRTVRFVTWYMALVLAKPASREEKVVACLDRWEGQTYAPSPWQSCSL